MSETVPYYAFNRLTCQMDYVGEHPSDKPPVLEIGVYTHAMTQVELERILTCMPDHQMNLASPEGKSIAIRRCRGSFYETIDNATGQMVRRKIQHTPTYVTATIDYNRSLRWRDVFHKRVRHPNERVQALIDALNNRGDVVALSVAEAYREIGRYTFTDINIDIAANEQAFDQLFDLIETLNTVHSNGTEGMEITLRPAKVSLDDQNVYFSASSITVLRLTVPFIVLQPDKEDHTILTELANWIREGVAGFRYRTE